MLKIIPNTLIIIFVLLTQILFSQQSIVSNEPGYIGESSKFKFYSHYWLNMHHFLYNAALQSKESGIDAVKDSRFTKTLTVDELNILSTAITFYELNIISHDLRSSDYSQEFKKWLVLNNHFDSLPLNKAFQNHIQHLNLFNNVYKGHQWEQANNANLYAYRANIGLIEKYEDEFVNRLQTLSKVPWQREKIRVDISYDSKRDIPYTTTNPSVHIVMDSKRSTIVKGEWFELLLHESSHHLINEGSSKISELIINSSRAIGQKAPNQLWHAILFYLTGSVTQGILENKESIPYSTYMVRRNVFTEYYASLHRILPRYITEAITLEDAIQEIIIDYYQKKK